MLYWGSLALISLISALISLHARRHAHLYDPEQKIVHTWQSNLRGWIYSIYFLSIGVVSLVSTNVSSYMPWGLILLPFVFKQGEFNNDED